EDFGDRVAVHPFDLLQPAPFFEAIGREKPDEIYNLAGQSSVARSITEPLETWSTNADFVVRLLETIRHASPESRLYQASSIEMLGGNPGGAIRHDERSPLAPRTPYAAAKAAAHLLCGAYREQFNLRVACGIVSNHESHRRGPYFLSRKIADHVAKLMQSRDVAPLSVGNLLVARDWGYADCYADGIVRVLRQTQHRRVPDEGRNYRDYVLATGRSHAVWQMIDAAFRAGGFALQWQLDRENYAASRATFADSGALAVQTDPAFLRTAEPLVIEADPSRAIEDLGWKPKSDLGAIFDDMIRYAGARER
ncbi:MAG TPA: GDP-mannose 4,6-dehydratase, partial [Thermoanaerobaculia bacterium]